MAKNMFYSSFACFLTLLCVILGGNGWVHDQLLWLCVDIVR